MWKSLTGDGRQLILPLQRGAASIIDIFGDGAVLNLLYGIIDHEERYHKPFARHYGPANPIRTLDVRPGGLEHEVN